MTPRELVGERYDDALGMVRIVPAATREAFIAALTVAAPEVISIAPPTRVLREGRSADDRRHHGRRALG